jgi:hypothetical protein
MANGFLYDVRAVVDKASFSEGIAQVQKLGESSKKVILGIAGIATALIATATASAEVANSEMKMARAIGMGSDALATFKTSASIAGVSANGLIGSLSAIETKMQHLKTGEIDSGMAKNLAMLGIGYGEFAQMDSNQRMSAVFDKASKMDDQRLASQMISDVLGSAGREYYDNLKLAGKSLSQQLAESRQLNYMSESSRKKAVIFGMEIRAVKESGKSILQLFGSELAGAITPTIRKAKQFLISNREQIRKGIAGFAQNVGAVFNAIAGGIEKAMPFVSGLIDKFGGLDKVIVKVGTGFGLLKLAKVAGGIKSIVKGVSGLKLALGGLAGMGLGMIGEDVISHFMGGNSFIFDFLIPKIKEIYKELGDMGISLNVDGIKDLIKSLKDCWDNSEELRKTLLQISKISLEGVMASFVLTLNDSVLALKTLADALSKIVKGDFSGAFETLKEGGETFKERKTEQVKNALSTIKDENATIGQKAVAGVSIVQSGVAGVVVTAEELHESANKDYVAKQREKRAKKAGYTGGHLSSGKVTSTTETTETTETPKTPKKKKGFVDSVKSFFGIGGKDESINDGIISPNGHVTQLNPNDWVFAVKDLRDMASGFIPNVSTNNNNSNVSYVINQNFTVTNAGGNIRQQAYNGASEALRMATINANMKSQMMSGAR